MAKSKITIGVQVKDGSLTKLEKNAKNAAQAVDGLGAATEKQSKRVNAHQRMEKGAAQITSNSTKAFAKQAQTVGGSLVPAYAVLAANIFALTAAFGALQRSAALDQLSKGLEITGRAAGQNLKMIADGLKEITGNAIAGADAMRAAAVGASAGFSQDQMEGLAKVAKGASLALGRDMVDAMDRLTRGAAKLEPEILDELGIMVRLDVVTQEYAATLGKTAGQLTQFERRMAFTNAIIEQGERKFRAVQEAVEPNAYDLLAASLRELTQVFISMGNTVITPVVKLLAENIYLLGGAVAMFGTTVAKQMIPGLNEAANTMAKVSMEAAEASTANLKFMEGLNGVTDKIDDYVNSAKAGTATQTQHKLAIQQLTTKLNSQKGVLTRVEKSHKSTAEKIELHTNKVRQLQLALDQAKNSFILNEQANAASGAATATNAAANIKLTTIIPSVKSMIFGLNEALWGNVAASTAATKGQNFFARGLGITKAVTSSLTLSIKVLGIAMLNLIPIVGQVIFFGSLLFEAYDKFFGKTENKEDIFFAKQAEEAAKRYEEFPKVLEQLISAYEVATNNQDKFITGLKPLSGLLQQSSSAFSGFIREARGLAIAEDIEKRVEAQKEIIKITQTRAALEERLAKKGVNLQSVRDDLAIVGGDARTTSGQSQARGRLREVGLSRQEQLSLIDGTARIAELEGTIESLTKSTATYDEEKVRALAIPEIAQSVAYLEQMSYIFKDNASLAQLTGEGLSEARDILDFIANNGSLEIAAQRMQKLYISTQQQVESWEAIGENIKKVNALVAKTTAGSMPGIVGNAGIKDEERNLVRQLFSDLKAAEREGGQVFTEMLERARPALEELSKMTGSTFQELGEELKKESPDILGALSWVVQDLSELGKAYLDLGLAIEKSAQKSKAFEQAGLSEAAINENINSLTKQANFLEERSKVAGNTAEGAQLRLDLAKMNNQILLEEIKLREQQNKSIERVAGSFAAATDSAVMFAENNREVIAGANLEQSFQLMGTALTPMMDELRKLGPEGELVAQVAQGALVIGEVFSSVFEKIEAGSFGVQDALMATSAVLNQMSSIMNARAKAKEASIDREIEAEKRLDGKSRESTERILALEKKKEAAQRKAFNIDKKMKMAMAAINTATAVTQAYASAPPPFNIALAAMIGALGAAQIAMISGMTFEGGAASAGSNVPSSISIGNRVNSVDLATSRSASGELAYARGESGIGSGMSSFTPRGAFTGMEMRSAGGNTGIMVGEQGPEMFIPERPGRIVPADEVGGGGGGMNVTFEIHAIDSTGFVDIIQGHKGEFIGMLREAANAHGETFMESVNIHSLPPTGSKTRAASLRQFTKEK